MIYAFVSALCCRAPALAGSGTRGWPLAFWPTQPWRAALEAPLASAPLPSIRAERAGLVIWRDAWLRGVSLPCCVCGADISVQSNGAVIRGHPLCPLQVFTSQSMVKVTLPTCLQQASHSASPDLRGDLPVKPTGITSSLFSVGLPQKIVGSILN